MGNIPPENGWLEYFSFPFGMAYSITGELLVSGTVPLHGFFWEIYGNQMVCFQVSTSQFNPSHIGWDALHRQGSFGTSHVLQVGHTEA